jgi:hypothetical protein
MDYSIERFNERLQEEFGDRLRLRESKAEEAYVLEQRTHRGKFTPARRKDPTNHSGLLPVELDDKFIRARDGYDLILTVTKGTATKCPKCFLPMKVPTMKFGEVGCENCRTRGRRYRYIRAFYPLGESLLDHIKSIAPERGTTVSRVKSDDAAQAKSIEDGFKDANNTLGDALFEEAIRQIPKVGYTGHEAMWVRGK